MRSRNIISAIILLALTIGYGLMTANLPTRAIEASTQPSFFMGCDSLPVHSLRVTAHPRAAALGKHSTPSPMNVRRWKIFSGLIAVAIYLTTLRNSALLSPTSYCLHFNGALR